MKPPIVNCPACEIVRKQAGTGVWVSVCNIILDKVYNGQPTNYPNFEIVPSHCVNYTKCEVWREAKEKDWKAKQGAKYSSFEQGEKIRV